MSDNEINEIKQEDIQPSVQEEGVLPLSDHVEVNETTLAPSTLDEDEDDVAVFNPPTEEKPEEAKEEKDEYTSLEEDLPVIGTIQAESEKKETKEAKEVSKEEVVQKLLKIVGNDKDDLNLWTPSIRVLDEENKPVSKDVLLDPKRRILTDIEKIDYTDPKQLEEMIQSISIPAESPDNMVRYLVENPTNLEEENPTMIVQSMSDARELVSTDYRMSEKMLNEDDIELTQAVYLDVDPTQRTRSRRTSIKNTGGNLTGLRAKAAIMDALGMSTLFTLVLPHSGLVAIVSPPVAAEIIDFQYILDTSKINIGRSIGGSNYGTATWYINDKLVDLFISKLSYINLKDSSPENIRALLDPMDIPTIAWGLACTMYPDGYVFNRTALLDNGKAEHVRGRIWLPDMAIYANSRLSTRQKQHLIKAENTAMSNEEILSYRRDWKKEEEVPKFERLIHTRKITRKAGTEIQDMYVELGQSNMENYVEHGSAWDVYIKDAVTETLSMASDENIRSRYLSDKIQTTALREYSHFIRKIRIERYLEGSDKSETITIDIDSQESLTETLDSLSNVPELRNKLIEIVVEYINKQIKVVYGVPTVSEYEEKHNTTPVSNKIVPINTVIAFFTLTARIYQTLGIR